MIFINIGVGALIGYVTNYIAIKMLFRPYKPIKIGNITIFPQGVIIREKPLLAKKVGEVVRDYILSEKEIKKILTSKEVKEEIDTFLDAKLEEFLKKDLTSFIPKEELARNLSEFIFYIIQTKFPMFVSFISKDQIERLFIELDLGISLEKFIKKDYLKAGLSLEIEKFLESELPRILLKAQIDKIVEERVKSFDEKELEEMLFSLMQKHFGFINIAGAFIGGIIGAVQYFLS